MARHSRRPGSVPAWWAGVLGLLCFGAAEAGDTESQRFAAFLESVYQGQLAARPQLATEFGSKLGDDRWDDGSEAGQAVAAAQVRANLAAAKRQFDYRRLDEPAQLQYRVLLDEQQLLLERYRWRDHFYALNQIVGLHIDIPGILTGQQPLADEADARAYIRRIDAAKGALQDLTVRMRRQARKRIFMPRTVYPLLIAEARNVITGAPHTAGGDSPIYADFKRRIAALHLPAAREAGLIDAARTALVERLQPAYERLIAQLQSQQARTPITAGVWQLPEGDAFYAFLIRQFTTTDMTPEQIHAMGLAEVARSQQAIAALMQRLGFHGSLREFMAQVKADPHNYESNDEQGRAAYLERARRIIAAMQSKITDAFYGGAPLPLQIVRSESYKEASSPSGFYEPGTADGSRPGTVYLNLADMRVLPLYELEDLLYHEGIPGHHLQISTILTDPSIPQMRKVNEWWQDSAFVEGWGLYAERLGKDLGFFQDPYSELGLLSGELWRASRLVVDSGLHYKRWTRDQAIRYLNENTPSLEENNIHAVDRYLAVPGQATSFMVGMRRFVAERERAREALSSRFDLREYHRVALGSGYIPLWALHEKVSAWIDSKLAAAAPSPSALVEPGPNEELHRLFGGYWKEFLSLNPTLALSLGDPCGETGFDDSLTDGWRERMVGLLDSTLAASAAYRPDALSAADRTSLRMLRAQLTAARDFYAGPLFETARRLPIDQFQGRHTEFAADAAGSGDYPFRTIIDYDHALVRADRFAAWSDAAILRLREGVANGTVLPRLIVERILPQVRAQFGLPAERSEFWRPVAKMPADFPPAERRRLTRAYRHAITAVIEPAYARLYEYLQREYLSRARESVGLGAMPGGAALYAYDVRFHTTTGLSATEIHALGRAEVERIEADVAVLEGRLGYGGGLQHFFAEVRSDPRQKFTDRSEILPAFDAARARIMAQLPALFDALPRAEFQIRALPESARHSQSNGYYAPAAADGSRPGILWINPYAPGVSDRFNVMTITLHEGLPGHHLQTSIAQEQTDLPAFRRFDATTAYGEGWALYAESLGTELGVFDDPWSVYGHLNYALLRANRLVVDTGLHALGWDVAEGVQWMLDHSSMTREQAAAEVERYVAYPGQALAYQIGEIKIRALRDEARRVLGADYDIKAFHHAVLVGGSRPLDVLEEDIRGWISARAPGQGILNPLRSQQ